MVNGREVVNERVGATFERGQNGEEDAPEYERATTIVVVQSDGRTPTLPLLRGPTRHAHTRTHTRTRAGYDRTGQNRQDKGSACACVRAWAPLLASLHTGPLLCYRTLSLAPHGVGPVGAVRDCIALH